MDSEHDVFMRAAIAMAREGMQAGQTPFGSCIVRDGAIVATAHNRVWANTDITAHAEIECLRLACKALDHIDLSGCTLYSTCEPCPMCFTAIHWARIEHLYFGATIADAGSAGFHELTISNDDMKRLGKSPVTIHAPLLQAECASLFHEWLKRPGNRPY